MRTMRWTLLCTLLLAATAPSAPGHAFDAGISDMVKIGKNRFLTVNDRKHIKQDDDTFLTNTHPRLGMIHVKKKRLRFSDVILTYPLSMKNMPPNDLEAACVLPRHKHEVLVAESGRFLNRFGRIFHLKLTQKKDHWTARVEHVFVDHKRASTTSTPKHDQIEGMHCIHTPDARTVVVFTTLGGKDHPGQLLWGTLDGLDDGDPQFTQTGSSPIVSAEDSLAERDASALFLEQLSSKQWRVWTVAVDDHGDHGPFRSIIYSPGNLTWGQDRGLKFDRSKPHVGWVREGHKVEGLAGPTQRVHDSVMSIGTEDEALGGIWQPLFLREND